MTHRRYTRKDKVAAVTAAAASSVLAAAQETGIPRTTIAYWLEQPEFAELRQKTREEAADGWKVILHRAQERIMDLIPSMDADQIMVLGGIATDKSQLLTGGATSRTETRDLTADLDDHERAALKDAITAELAKRAEVEA